MSEISRGYQKFITGKSGASWLQNGVKFDGMINGRLIDAKAKYSNFINKKTGGFYDWFKGKDGFIDQAYRQLKASEGAPIDWYFMEENTMNAVKGLFEDRGIDWINLIYKSMD